MKKILTPLLLLATVCLFAQQKQYSINWEGEELILTESFSTTVPAFKPKKNFGYSFSEGLQFSDQWKISNLIDERSVTLENVTYSSISSEDLKGIDRSTIPSSIKYSLKNSIDRNKKSAYLSVSPIIKSSNNVYKKVESFTVKYTNYSGRSSAAAQQPLVNSALLNGSWYRFSINKSGVFRLSKDFLSSIGVNVNTVNPKTIKLYGNGGKMIPYLNSEVSLFDITENAIQFVGEEDGVINNGDYILFYGQGPEGDIDNPLINTNLNPYIDKAYYYINVSAGNGKRINTALQPSGNADLIIDEYDDFQFHEVDEYNLASVGRRWFGDKFDIESTKTFDFNFPNLKTEEPINFKTFLATASSETSTMAIRINGTEIVNVNLAGASPPNLLNDNSYQDDIIVNSPTISVEYIHDNFGNPSATAYIDYITIRAKGNLSFYGSQFKFKLNETANLSGIAEYTISNASNLPEVWDVTDIHNVTTYQNTNNDAAFSFKSEMGTLKNFVAISPSDFYSPTIESNSLVTNQDLKGRIFLNEQGSFQDVDYLIVTKSNMLTQANRLAEINRNQYNLNVKVVTLNEIYNEFNTGNADIGAIRNFVKYIYDNASTPENRIKYLCLFGDSSYDYKDRIENNTNIVPSWHAYISKNLTSSFVSDDFYGMMDFNEGTMESSNKLDIAVGRILADTPQRAKTLVDKIESYYAPDAYGSWRNKFLVISDDIDEEWEKILQNTTDEIGDAVTQEKPFINVVKLHADAFQQEASAGGDRYPQVTEEISNVIESGVLVANYFGHGGEDGLAKERIYQKPEAQNLRNTCKLNCFVTVTCEYTRFDNPLRETAGEFIFWNDRGGAISLITTTRQIFVTAGVDFNVILEQYLFSFNDEDDYADHEYPTMAEALRLAKNDPELLVSSQSQKSLIFFIGDPAMKLAFPKPNIRLTKINDVPIDQETDVLQALGFVKLAGEVTDVSGNILSNYNGVVSTTIYDKEIQRQTLANDNICIGGGTNCAQSQKIRLDFNTLGEIVFRGQASVVNGEFEFEFVVPRDISIPVGNGKISFYSKATNALLDQTGANTDAIKIGGINENAAEDNIGPLVNLYMNDENFVSGSITNSSPTLLVKLEDDNGINTASGIGHDIVAILDGDETNPYILNDYYQTEVDDYKRGEVTFPFRDLEPGLHTLTLKAWDVYNNSGTAEIQFLVVDENQELVITNVLNYPNPFVSYTEFWFNHNSSDALDITVQIFTITGKLVRTLNGQTENGTKITSSVSRDIMWDGRDDFGDKIGKGVYVYKLKVHSNATNKTVEKIEKLVIL
ncbi:type IX secretion system sortase PorU [Lacinutrix salivirga]